ncbi:MAG: hypothetical protein V4805_02690 [Pseudomonadota bacterium]
MDNETFQLLARFIIKTRKIIGAVDSNRLVNDQKYAAETFDKVEAVADEEVMMLSLTLRHRLGLLQQEPAKPEQVKKPEPAPEPPSPSKYKFGARS